MENFYFFKFFPVFLVSGIKFAPGLLGFGGLSPSLCIPPPGSNSDDGNEHLLGIHLSQALLSGFIFSFCSDNGSVSLGDGLDILFVLPWVPTM